MTQVSSINRTSIQNQLISFNYAKNKNSIKDKIQNHCYSNKIEKGVTKASSLESLVNKIGLKRIRKIGSGSFGTVFKFEDKKTHKPYAVKIMQFKNDRGSKWLEVTPEFSRISSRLELPRGEGLALVTPDHPNILKTHGLFLKSLKTSHYRYVTDVGSIIDESFGDAKEVIVGSVMEIVPHAQDLFDFVANRQKELEKEAVRDLGKQIAQGLAELHQNNLSHRDLKLANILIDKEGGQIKIIDFGLSRNLATTRRGRSDSCVGSPSMAAPELWEGTGSTELGDAWAFGVTLYAIAFRRYPFGKGNDSNSQIRDNVLDFVKLGKKFSHWNKKIMQTMKLGRDLQLCDLLDRLLCREEDRMSVKEAIEHPFFRESVSSVAAASKEEIAQEKGKLNVI